MTTEQTRTLTLTAILTMSALAGTVMGASFTTAPIAPQGAVAPGASPNTFGFSIHPVIAPTTGRVSLATLLNEPSAPIDSTIHSGQPGSLTLTLRGGSSIPGLAGKSFGASFIYDANLLGRIAAAGDGVAFIDDILGAGQTSTTDLGLFSNVGGTMTLVARDRTQVPVLPAGINYFFRLTSSLTDSTTKLTSLDSTNDSLVLQADGRIAFRTELDDGGQTIIFDTTSRDADNRPNANHVMLIGGLPSDLKIIARYYNNVPNAGPTARYRAFTNPTMDASGKVYFVAVLSGSLFDVGFGTDTGLYGGLPGSIAKIARGGDAITDPAIPAGSVFSSFTNLFWGGVLFPDSTSYPFNTVARLRCSTSANGTLAFYATFDTPTAIFPQDGTDGIFVGKDLSTFRIAARDAAAAPGGGVFVSFLPHLPPLVNDNGVVMFPAIAGPVGTPQTTPASLFRGKIGALAGVIRTGAAAPGVVGGSFNGIISHGMNRDGQGFALVELFGVGITSSNNRALYFIDCDNSLTLVARTGSIFPGQPTRTVKTIRVTDPSSGGDGQRSGFFKDKLAYSLGDNASVYDGYLATFTNTANCNPAAGCNRADITDGSGNGGPDGALTAQDVVVFFGDFFKGCTTSAAPCNRADITDASGNGGPDGQLSAQDVVIFFGDFFKGCAAN